MSRQAEKDKKLLKAAGLEKKARFLLDVVRDNPFQNPPEYEALVGNLKGNYSRRVNIQHRLVYSVHDNVQNLKDDDGNLFEGIVFVKRMWTHYYEG